MSSPESSPVNVAESSPQQSQNETQTQRVLTQEQVQRMENNRKRALEIRKSKETGIKM